MTQITLRSQAVQLQQSAASGWTLQNTGANPLYLDNNPSVSPATGYVVLPGVALPIENGAVLWACATDALPTTVATVQGVQSASATNVNVSGPVSIGGSVNANITNASLPVTGNVNANITNASIPVSGTVAISSGTVNASISGPVSISSGTVNVGNTVTTVGQGTTLASTTENTSSGTVAIGTFTGLTPYGSVIVNVGSNSLGGAASAKINQVQLLWYDAAGVYLTYDLLACSDTGVLNATIPVQGSRLVANWIGAGVAGATNIPVTITAIPNVLERRVYHWFGNTSQAIGVTSPSILGDLTKGYLAAGWNTVNGSIPTLFFNSRGGPAALKFSNFDAAGAHQFQITALDTGSVFFRHTTAANTTDGELAYMPEGPVQLTMNAAATAVYQEIFAIMWDPT